MGNLETKAIVDESAASKTTSSIDIQQPLLLDYIGFPVWVRYVITNFNQSSSFIAKLYNIEGHYERVKFFLSQDIIKTKMENYVKELVNKSEGEGRKNLEQSKIFIEHAKKLKGNNDLNRALEWYNKGILSSPFPGDEVDIEFKERLSLLLHERSDIYKLMKKWPEAWADADDAVKYNPVNSRITRQLIKSRNNLFRFIKSKVECHVPDKNPFFDFVDVGLNSHNDDLHGAASCLKMSYSNKKGYGLVSKINIKADKLLIAEEPFVHLLTPSYRDYYCAHCLKSLKDRPFPCRGCVYLRFCSSECSEKAWDTYHSKECSHIAALMFIPKGHFALRAFLTVGVNKALTIYCKSFKNKKSVDNNKMRKFRNNLEDILTLFGYEDTQTDDVMLQNIGCATFTSILACTIGLIADDYLVDFTSLTFKFLSVASINATFILNNDVYTDPQGNIRPSHFVNATQIGIGLYSSSSLIKHSSYANCYGWFFGPKMVTQACRTISSNEELTKPYVCSTCTKR